MVDFWEAKRQQLQQEGKLLPPRQEPVTNAWWDETGSITQTRTVTSDYRDNLIQDHLANDLGKHDFSKATHLKSKAGNCPNCGSGNYVKPSASSSTRCFECGYIEGRVVNDLDNFALTPDAKRLSVRQVDSAHGLRSVRSAADIAVANAQLEASALGKAQIDR